VRDNGEVAEITSSVDLSSLAHDLIVWTRALLLSGELAKAEPKRLRYRLLHVAGCLTFSGRRAVPRLQASWPWAGELAAAFARLKALPRPPDPAPPVTDDHHARSPSAGRRPFEHVRRRPRFRGDSARGGCGAAHRTATQAPNRRSPSPPAPAVASCELLHDPG
jgi:hypothetical protein